MSPNPRDSSELDDFDRIIASLNKHRVDFMIIGGCPELKPEVFTEDNGISLGEIPVKVDVISKLPGVDFDQAWARRATGPFGSETVSFISREDLISNKRAVARPKDLLDVVELEAGRRL